MELSASGRIIHGVAPAFALLLLGSLAAGAEPEEEMTISGISRCATAWIARRLKLGSMVARR